jgi:hypothetical protein
VIDCLADRKSSHRRGYVPSPFSITSTRLPDPTHAPVDIIAITGNSGSLTPMGTPSTATPRTWRTAVPRVRCRKPMRASAATTTMSIHRPTAPSARRMSRRSYGILDMRQPFGALTAQGGSAARCDDTPHAHRTLPGTPPSIPPTTPSSSNTMSAGLMSSIGAQSVSARRGRVPENCSERPRRRCQEADGAGDSSLSGRPPADAHARP